MDTEVHMDTDSSTTVPSTCTTPTDSELMEDRLPKISATPISVCRRLVLQQAVQTLGLSMHETTTYDDESNEILAAVRIDVPPHIRLARFETRLFYGDWSQTSDAAIQSACFNALVYLQKADILVIDGIHSAELKRCKRELLQASSWEEAFEQHASQLQTKLSALVKDKGPVLPISRNEVKIGPTHESTDVKTCVHARILAPSGPARSSLTKLSTVDKGKTPVLHVSQNQAKVHMTEEMTDTEKCTDEQLLAPSGSTQLPPNVLNEQWAFNELPLAALPDIPEHPPLALRIFRNLPFGQLRKPGPLPVPEPAVAAFNRKKRKLVVDSRRPRSQVAALPSLRSSLNDMSAAITDCSNETAYVNPVHVDVGSTLPSLSTPPSVSRTVALKCKETVPLYSKVRKPLFQAEDKGRAADVGDKLLGDTGDLGGTDEEMAP